MKFLVFGMFAILGLGSMLILATQTTTMGYLTFGQVEREQVFYTDWNPCYPIMCDHKIPATYIGHHKLTDAIQCQCPSGKIFNIRDRNPKRIFP